VFATTHWSVVLAAGAGGSPQAHAALAKLCQAYWYPLYAYVRRQGYSAPDAQDLTQEFFARLLQSHLLAAADPKRGRFRSFLLASVKHFLMHEWEKARALKRGGGRPPISFDAGSGEARYGVEPVENTTAEHIFERRWALTLLGGVLERLRDEFAAGGKTALFETLKPALTGEPRTLSHAETAHSLGMTEGAVKVAVHRLRQRYGELLREEIGQTVASPGEVEEELRYLLSVLSA
jgi:DNA-directed RNA polymerase specialized sigma24 family protein